MGSSLCINETCACRFGDIRVPDKIAVVGGKSLLQVVVFPISAVCVWTTNQKIYVYFSLLSCQFVRGYSRESSPKNLLFYEMVHINELFACVYFLTHLIIK